MCLHLELLGNLSEAWSLGLGAGGRPAGSGPGELHFISLGKLPAA